MKTWKSIVFIVTFDLQIESVHSRYRDQAMDIMGN